MFRRRPEQTAHRHRTHHAWATLGVAQLFCLLHRRAVGVSIMNVINFRKLASLLTSSARFACIQLLVLGTALCVVACGGGGSGASLVDVVPNMPLASPAPAPTSKVLAKPVLSFTDTGLSVTDGVTQIGAWQVSSLESWEYSLDMGKTWIRGQGDSFLVEGDGAKTIWVRARDDMGNTSEIVVVSCVLDTMPPPPVQAEVLFQNVTRLVKVNGVEAQGKWEYSLDDQRSWSQGTGDLLAVMGNALPMLWLRQVDLAGNRSPLERVNLQELGSATWHEASGNPLQPSPVFVQQARTVIMHGSVVRGDADYIRWDIPVGQRLEAMRLVHYVSSDPIAFFALQTAPVFDAGVDVSRMLIYGHMGPQDLRRNVVRDVPPAQLRAGPMTLWFQQTGPSATEYAIELLFAPEE